MTTSPAVVFFGTEHFSAPSLQALIDAGYKISYVITKPDTPRGRGRILESPEVKKIAQQHDIAVLQPQKLAEIYDTLSELDSPLGILVAYGKIIPQSIIDLFTPGIMNVHPSLLPRYRGPSPLEAAILNGDHETGISIMQLSAAMDAGPVYTQTILPLRDDETKPILYEEYAKKGAALLIETIPKVLNNTLQPWPQDDSAATYCSLLTKEDGILDPEHKTASQLMREVRAYLGYPKSRLNYQGQQLIVTAAHIASSEHDGSLVVTCKQKTFLSIDQLIAPSGKKMNAEAFIRGLR